MSVATIAFIVSSLNPGGVERKLVAVVNRLDREAFRPVVFCLHGGGALISEIQDAPVYAGLLANKYDGRVLPRLVSFLRRERATIVFCLGAYDAGWWGRWAALIAGVPIRIVSLHRTEMLNDRAAVDALNRWLTPVTDCFIAMSERHRHYLITCEKLPERKVVAIPNGVDTTLFCPSSHNQRLRAELGIPLDIPLVGLVGRLRPEKAHDVFLQAAVLVRETMPQAMFVLVGDGPLRPQIEAQIEGLGLGERVLLLGYRRDMPDVYAALNVCVLCSRNENFPNVLLEAMACEVPVVASAVGSIPDIVPEGEGGRLIPPGDPEALASAVVDLLNHPIRAQALGKVGRQRVERLFTLETMVSRRERLFADLMRIKGIS